MLLLCLAAWCSSFCLPKLRAEFMAWGRLLEAPGLPGTAGRLRFSLRVQVLEGSLPGQLPACWVQGMDFISSSCSSPGMRWDFYSFLSCLSCWREDVVPLEGRVGG